MTGTGPPEAGAAPTAAAQPPVWRIERGDPTPEELAAVVAVLTAAAAGAARRHPEPTGQWRSRRRNVRPVVSRGPDAWRASGFPR